MSGEQLSELEMSRIKGAYAKGYMAGLEDAKKPQLSGLTGKPVLKKVWMKCPKCKAQSPVQDPDYELLEALQSFLRAPSVGSAAPGSITIVVQDFNLRAARAAIAKFTGSAA